MSWARLDDHANEHRKQLAAGAEACWLWACGLMYANRQKARDGFIPEAMVAGLFPVKSPKKLAEKLVEVRLWVRADGGFQIHDYHVLNPTKEQYEDALAGGRARAAKSYAARTTKNGVSSPEDSPKNSDSSGVEWAGDGLGSDRPNTESTPQVTAQSADLRSKAAAWVKDPQRAALEAPNPEKWPETAALVSALAEVFGGPQQLPRHAGDPRMRAVLGLWSEGRTMVELEQAIRGAGKDPHYRANPQFQTLQTILKDSAQVDKFIRLLTVEPVTTAKASSRGPVQNNHGKTGTENARRL